TSGMSHMDAAPLPTLPPGAFTAGSARAAGPPAPPPAPLTVPPPPAPPVLATAWPRSAQWAAVFLLGAAAALLALHVFQSQRWGSRPTDLQPGVPFGHQIELNRADRAELLQLPGVGENLPRRIEQYRREHGRFRSVEELR